MKILDKYEALKHSIKEFREGHALELDSMNRVISHTPLGKIRDEITKGYDDVQKINENTEELRHQRKLTDFIQGDKKGIGKETKGGWGWVVEGVDKSVSKNDPHTTLTNEKSEEGQGVHATTEKVVRDYFDTNGNFLGTRVAGKPIDDTITIHETKGITTKDEEVRKGWESEKLDPNNEVGHIPGKPEDKYDENTKWEQMNQNKFHYLKPSSEADEHTGKKGEPLGDDLNKLPRKEGIDKQKKSDPSESSPEKTVESSKDDNNKPDAAKSEETSSDVKKASLAETKQPELKPEQANDLKLGDSAQRPEQVASDTRQTMPDVSETKPKSENWRKDFDKQFEPESGKSENLVAEAKSASGSWKNDFDKQFEPEPSKAERVVAEPKPETESWKKGFDKQFEPTARDQGNELPAESPANSSDQASVAETRRTDSVFSESKSEPSKDKSSDLSAADADRSAMESANKEVHESKATDHVSESHSDRSSDHDHD
jgi:hypothetical protein